MIRTSRCSCGECTVAVDGEPVYHGLCNCNDCRRRTGAPFGWSAYFLNTQVGKVEGPLTVRALEGDFRGQKRWFCSQCGTTLFWKNDTPNWKDLTGMAAGCFNDPTFPAPTSVHRYSQRMPWVVFPRECAIFDN